MTPMFIIMGSGLTRTFNIITGYQANSTVTWYLGDGNESTETRPTHTYNEEGFYEVKLVITTDTVVEEASQTLVLSSTSLTQLRGSIYTLIDSYVPTNLVKELTFTKKQVYIEKWQLYLQPIVNHEVLVEEYNNELRYEALENQLIMELAMYDILINVFTNLLQSVSSSHTVTDEEQSSTPTANGNVKKIVTGPSQVEFFDGVATDSEVMASATKAVAPGGILDTLRSSLCTLAERLEIYIPYCHHHYLNQIPVVQRTERPTRVLRGPNPPIVNK